MGDLNFFDAPLGKKVLGGRAPVILSIKIAVIIESGLPITQSQG